MFIIIQEEFSFTVLITYFLIVLYYNTMYLKNMKNVNNISKVRKIQFLFFVFFFIETIF